MVGLLRPAGPLWLTATSVVFSHCCMTASATGEHRNWRSAPLVDQSRLPLRTKGRYIVNTLDYRVKWACVNWAGAYFTTHVVGGLSEQPLANLSRTISTMGFNCVRLPYSTQGWSTNPVVADRDVEANPQFKGGKRFREIFKAVVDALTAEGLMVIINNHNHKSGWCCTVDQDEGLWYVPGFNESTWIESLIGLAEMFKSNPLVVAFDIRNEPHDIRWKYVTWGDGNPETDWAAAATRAGDAVLNVNPDVLVVISALCFCMDLGPIKVHPIKLRLPNRVVYEVHNYIEFQLATLVTNNFMSWRAMQRMSWPLLASMLLVVGICLYLWTMMGSPSAPSGACSLTVFSWCSVVFVLVLVVLFIMYSFYQLYCNYYARTFIWQLIVVSSGCLLVSLLCMGRGIARFRSGVLAQSDGEEESSEEEYTRGVFKSGLDVKVDNGEPYREESYDTVEPHWRSVSVAQQIARAKWDGTLEPGSTPMPPVAWDYGLCCGLQVCVASAIFGIVVLLICAYAAIADSYFYLQLMFDFKWAFALDEGHEYTAPVWLGEFGQNARGRYWMHLMSYMAVRDLDFAYWPLNGMKLAEGYFNGDGTWHAFEQAEWQDESFGLLEKDFKTLRHPWKLLDLQAIMSSPAGWVSDSYPCEREVLGNACGG